MLLSLPGPARGDDTDAKQTAAKLVDQGNSAYAKGSFDDALSAYRAAYQAYPSPKILLNLAQAEQAKGRPDLAAGHYEEFLASGNVGPKDPQRSLAQNRLAVLQREISQLVFEEQAPDTTLRVNGGLPSPLPGDHLWVVPGRHELVFERSGHEPMVLDLQVGGGSRIPLRVALRPLAPTSGGVASVPAPPPPDLRPPPPPPPVSVETPAPTESGGTKWWLWIGLGVVVVAGAAVAVAMTTGGSDVVPNGELGTFNTSTWMREGGP